MTIGYPLLREAKVISVQDPDELGRVQLKVYPELSEHPDNDLPWCFPFSGGESGKDFGLPEEGKTVTCIVWNRFWTEITFLPFVISPPKEHLFKKWIDDWKSKIEDLADDPEEKDLKVRQFSDGFSAFHDVKNSAHGVIHPSGTYAMVDKDGNIFIKGVKKLTLHDGDGNFNTEVDMSSGDVNLETKGKFNIKIDGETSIENKGKLTIKSNDDFNIESKANINIKATQACKVESTSEVTVKAAQCVIDSQILNFKGTKSQGTVPPSGSGVLCGIPACICSGAPHVG